MDDDEEIHPQDSPSQANGRIAVTVAAAQPPEEPNYKNLASDVVPAQPNIKNLALSVVTQIKTNGGREDCWSEGATAVLIDAWGERYLELSRGNLKQKHWKEVADIVSGRDDCTKTAKTDIQCKNRIDTVKKKYKLEKAKIAAGGGPSKWVFFERLDRLIGPTAKTPVVGANNKVPVGIPVRGGGAGGSQQYKLEPVKLQFKGNVNNLVGKNQNVKLHGRKRGQVETESESEEEDEEEENFVDSDDSLPPEKKVRRVVGRGVSLRGVGKERRGWGSSIRMLTQAILKFGEVYEQAESAKLQQVVEMEKARLKFAKELELQRMQFLLKTQMEISQLKHETRGGGDGGGRNAGNLHSGSNNVTIKDNNSDSDN